MGLEFLKDHGASRMRSYPEQPALDLPEDAEGDEIENEELDHDFECKGDTWRAIPVHQSVTREDESPRRFIDGCHAGQTIAWLQDDEGHPVPLMLAEIGGVCLTSESRELRRTFQIVERVVSFAIDPFPWEEVESFALALADSGFRLLPMSLWRPGTADWAASYDFEEMRRKTTNRSNYEMEVLEEAALCHAPEIPTVIDGRIGSRISSQAHLQTLPIVGVIKQHRKGYLHPQGWMVYYHLKPAERTPAFLIKSKSVPVVSWYLKLDGDNAILPNWGVVRVELAARYFEAIGNDFSSIDRLSHELYRMRCRSGAYRRGPVSLEPIVRAEESLKSLFTPTSALGQRFYHLTGL